MSLYRGGGLGGVVTSEGVDLKIAEDNVVDAAIISSATSGWQMITGTFYDTPSVANTTTVTAQDWVLLDNPGVGAFNDSELPSGVASTLYDTSTQTIQLSSLNRKDELQIEINYLMNVDTANSAPSFKVVIDEGLATEFSKIVRSTAINFASLWIDDIARLSFFVGSSTTAKIYARCDEDAELSVKNYTIYLIR